jgi:hypothetical protein
VATKIKDRNKFDAIYPISLFKRNLNSVLRKFESKNWTHVLITRNSEPVAEVIHPLTSENGLKTPS